MAARRRLQAYDPKHDDPAEPEPVELIPEASGALHIRLGREAPPGSAVASARDPLLGQGHTVGEAEPDPAAPVDPPAAHERRARVRGCRDVEHLEGGEP